MPVLIYLSSDFLVICPVKVNMATKSFLKKKTYIYTFGDIVRINK